MWFWIPFCLGFDISAFRDEKKKLLLTSAAGYSLKWCHATEESNP